MSLARSALRSLIAAMFALGLLAGWPAATDAAADPVKVVYCGIVAANSITSGEGSGPGTRVLLVTNVPGGGPFVFGTAPSVTPPTIGTYICGQFTQGVPMNGLLALLGPGDPGYVAGPSAQPIVCGTLQALVAPNRSTAGGGVNEGGGSATIAGKTYRLSSALPSDAGKNVIGDGVAVGKRVCLSGDPVAGAADLLNNYLVFASDVDVCGPISYYRRATASTNNELGLTTASGFRAYQLVGAGSAPEDLGARSTAFSPEVVRLVGRSVQGINTVTDYEVTRVPSCSGLPNTSTSVADDRSRYAIVVVGMAALAVLVLTRRRRRAA